MKNTAMASGFILILLTHLCILGVHAESAFTVKSDKSKAVYISSLVNKKNVQPVKPSIKLNPKADLQGNVTNKGKFAVEVVLFSGLQQSKSPVVHVRFRFAPGESKALGGLGLYQKNTFAQKLLSQKAVVGMAVATVDQVTQLILVDVSNLDLTKNIYMVNGMFKFHRHTLSPADAFFLSDALFLSMI